jgi:hypothetical protein
VIWRNSEGPLTVMMDNVLASRMGHAARAAAASPGGDRIDTGLGLLRLLTDAGFEVRYVGEPAQPSQAQQAGVTEAMVEAAFDAWWEHFDGPFIGTKGEHPSYDAAVRKGLGVALTAALSAQQGEGE